MSAAPAQRATLPAMAFLLGLALPLALHVAGYAFPQTYDEFVLSFLYRHVLEWLPVIAVVAAVLGLVRAESLRAYPAVLFAIGAAVALPLVNDWWYFAPVSLAALVVVGVWQAGVQLWSHSRAASIVIGALIAASVGRVAWDLGGPGFFDARFGVGIPTRWEPFLRWALAVMPLALTILWMLRRLRRGAEPAREKIAAVIEDDPRCTDYFAAAEKFTRTDFVAPASDARSGARLPTCAPAVAASTAPAIFPDLAAPSWAQRCAGATRFLAGRFAWLAPLLRRLRSAAVAPGHPSAFVRGMLEEAALSEARAARRALYGPESEPLFDRLATRLPEQRLEAQAEANRHFQRHVQLREALIDAHYLLFLPVPVLPPSQWEAEARSARERLVRRYAPPNSPPPRPAVLAGPLQAASQAMLALWLDVLDWQFCEHGERMTASDGSALNLAQLTCNVLTLRRAAREAAGTADSPHAAACDLALWLFVGACVVDGAAVPRTGPDITALQRYFEALGGNGANLPRAEATLAAAGYALRCLAIGDWRDAPRGFASERGHGANGDVEARWLARTAGFAKAGYALGMARSNPLGAGPNCTSSLMLLADLDGDDPPEVPGAMPAAKGLRQMHFVLHLHDLRASTDARRAVAQP